MLQILFRFALIFAMASAAAQEAPVPAVAAATTSELSAAPTADPQEQLALRKLKTDITAAVSRRDFGAADAVLHKPFMATLVTQESFTDMQGMKAYYEHLLTTANPKIKDMSIAAEVDGLSQIYTGTFAVNKGSTAEHYVLADGRSFDMKGRWTAVSIKETDGKWKILAVHTGINFMDNPVLNVIEKSVVWTGLIGLAVGLILGIAGAWLVRKLRVRR